MLTKMVDGKEIIMSDDEEAMIRAEWKANDEAQGIYEKTEKYKDDRKREYPKVEELISALWDKIIENNDEPCKILQDLRLKVKERYPKPS